MLDLFTMVFLLSIDHETQLQRLDTPDNADRNAAQRAQILKGRATFERQMRAAGAVVLDGSRPTADLGVASTTRYPPRTGGANPRIAPARECATPLTASNWA